GYVEAKALATAMDDNLVTFSEFEDVAEKGVAVRRDHGVAGFAGNCCLLEVSGALAKLRAGCPFQDDGIQLDPGNLQANEHFAGRDRWPACVTDRSRSLMFPLLLQCPLRLIHIEIPGANVTQQACSNDQER